MNPITNVKLHTQSHQTDQTIDLTRGKPHFNLSL